MKKLSDIGDRNFKKVELDFDEHDELAHDLEIAKQILEPWLERFYKAYSVNGKEVKELKKVLNLLHYQISVTQDYHWFKKLNKNDEKGLDSETRTSPYC